MPFNAHAKVTKEVVAELLATKHREDRTLDYKQALPGTNDDARNDFLADVTAMANTSGGVILYGVEEQRDADGKATGQPERVCGLPGVNVEQERQRLVNWLKSSVDPNIPGVDIYEVVGVTDGPVIAVQTPRSWSAPHLIQMGKRVAFYRRNSVGNQPMDWHEIRSAFAAGAGERERIERFRNDRIGRIISNSVGWNLVEGPKLILHVVPYGAVGGESAIDVSAVFNPPALLQHLNGAFGLHRYTLEGALDYVPFKEKGTSLSHVVLYREGMIEAVDGAFTTQREHGVFIPSLTFEQDILAAVPRYLALLKRHGLAPPILLLLAATGVRGARMGVNQSQYYAHDDSTGIMHDTVVLPPALVTDYDGDLHLALKPMIDGFWNAAGWPQSPYWNEEDKWIGGKR